jgi:hypothetical protein
MNRPALFESIGLVARLALGGVYLYMGTVKALHPVDFLKLLREYPVLSETALLNAIAIILPWFEVFCAALLLGGIAIRGTALVSLVMLIPFTAVILQRALAVHGAGDTPFCAIRFDCGCGAGEVVICHKLLENAVLMLLSAWLLAVPHARWSLRANLVPRVSPGTT